ncbi:zinc/manganese transport system ATP-binding protein [Arboricoccus pini]|uniref:Zinc/manganese transport system ATP-binding protein n=1 Tax=Arboricoccus pini TaxID=1963835 RepID=A0A212RVR1_9PROT|nr:ABC transporter ATP-binding protein [Arboricoccus pini]SNB76807.1 zinc/manganese transport system ATP-binding protein [Arboricoccus pini]
MSEAAITLDDLTLAYDRRPAVQHVSGVFPCGSLTAIVGPNGAGKSTLLKGIVGLIRPSRGRVTCASGRAQIAYLPQQAEIDRSFPIMVGDAVAAGAWRRIGVMRAIGPDIRGQVQDALSAVGLEGFARRPVGSLSAGQFQRVLFARLLLQDASIILLDEPFNAVDQRTTADLLRLVRHWHGEQRTIIAVLHDYEQVRAHFPTTLLLARRLLEWGPTANVMTPANLHRMRGMSEDWEEAGFCLPEAHR